MAMWNQTPTFRGYNSFHGFYSGGQDYFTHSEANGLDSHIDVGARCGPGCSTLDRANVGVYSTHLYAASAQAVIAAHDEAAAPLFIYLAFQAVHSPDQVPQSYIDPYNATIADPKRRVFAGMLSALDEAVGNVTAAAAAALTRRDTLFVFVADNGGPIFCTDGPCGDATGTSNFPLRGGKHSLWEGGTRLTALVAGPMVHGRGVNESGLMHHADWLPTLMEAAGVAYAPAPGFELHGASQWPMLTRGAPSSRNETVTNIDPLQPAVGAGPPGQGNAAIITADGWKLLLGLTGPPDSWSPPNASKRRAAAAAPACAAAGFANGTCYPGHSVPGVANPTDAATPAACCAHCASVPGCVAWTFRVGARACWTKNAPAPSPTPFAVWPLKNMTAQLFNVFDDPEERNEIGAAHPDIVAALSARLAQWGEAARDPYFRLARVDPLSNPALRNDSWVPWL